MNIKSILIAGILAIALIAMGFLANRDSGSQAADASAGQLVLPGLFDSINDVSELLVKTTDGEFHVKRQGETWVLTEKDGYPIDVNNVRSTLVSLAEIKTVEEKTSNPDRHVQLGVQSVGANPQSDTQSKQVDLLDSSGETIASLILGKTRSGGGGKTFYVRRPSEMASWLVEGTLPELPDSGDTWLDKKIVEFKRDDMRAVRTTHADGEVLTISKTDEDKEFTVHDMPAERELTYAAVAGGIAGALQYMNFEDVMKFESFEAPGDPVAVSSFWTKDGLRLNVKIWEQDEKTLAAFEAAYDMDGAPTIAAGPMPEPEEGEALAVASPRPQAEVEAEASELNARLSAWIFEIPTYSKTNLTKRMDGLLKPLPEPEEEAEPDLDLDAPIDIDSLGGE
ncbi:MAG: hypothetical protein ACI9F9_002582 [Candidatus Paceibacteria bacterium]|jgi:hypothetical protein